MTNMGPLASKVLKLMEHNFCYEGSSNPTIARAFEQMCKQFPQEGIQEKINALEAGLVKQKRFGLKEMLVLRVELTKTELQLIKSISIILDKPELEEDLRTAALYCKLSSSNDFIDIIEEFAFLRDQQAIEKQALPPKRYADNSSQLNPYIKRAMFSSNHTDPYLHQPGRSLIKNDGNLLCACCLSEGEEILLFTSKDVGFQYREWPNFTQAAVYKHLDFRVDFSVDLIRAETTCARCGGHLGHIFRESLAFAQQYHKDDPQVAIDVSVSNHSFCTNASSLCLQTGKEKPRLLVKHLAEQGVTIENNWIEQALKQNPDWLAQNQFWAALMDSKQKKAVIFK